MTQYATRAERRAAQPTETPNRLIVSVKARGYVFGVIAAAGPLLIGYGLVTADQMLLWLGLGGAVLGLPASVIAGANLPKGK